MQTALRTPFYLLSKTAHTKRQFKKTVSYHKLLKLFDIHHIFLNCPLQSIN